MDPPLVIGHEFYGEIVEVSAIVGVGRRPDVTMSWGRTAQIGHFRIDLVGVNGGAAAYRAELDAFVAAVRGGLLSLEEACQRYTLTVDEFLSWQMSIDQHGLAGLRTTRIQHYRQ